MDIHCPKCSGFITEIMGDAKAPAMAPDQRIPCRRCNQVEVIVRFTPEGIKREFRPRTKRASGQ